MRPVPVRGASRVIPSILRFDPFSSRRIKGPSAVSFEPVRSPPASPSSSRQANAASVGTEDFQTAFAKVLGLTLVIPNVLGAVSAAVPGAAPIVSPLNSFTEIAKAYYGMSNRAAMRRRFNIVGVTECAGLCSCFSFAFDGDVEQTDDFCCYLCCFPCAVCQETRHMRRHNLGDIGRRFAPYGQRYWYGYEGGEIDYVNGGDGRPPGGYAPPGPQMFPAPRK